MPGVVRTRRSSNVGMSPSPRIEALLVQRAIEALEGFTPDPDTPIIIRDMTMKDALILLGHHRRTIEGGPRSRRQWARPRTLDEVRGSILRKLEAIEGARRKEQESEPTGDGGDETPADWRRGRLPAALPAALPGSRDGSAAGLLDAFEPSQQSVPSRPTQSLP
jgi:hypothetical protein